jgi:hypothetical protein
MSETSIIHSLNISSAPLPVAYENAKMAIYQCNELDECKDWSDKAQALASYARQSADEELEKMSKRIRARAIRRCGELLKLLDGRGKNNQYAQVKRDGGDPSHSKSEVGESVGLSERQIKQANRLSNIPEDDFNRQVESNNVPTLTALAKQGTKPLTEQQIKNREWLEKPKPEGFADAIHTIGMMKELKYYTDKFEPEYILGGMDEDGKKKAIEIIKSLESWFDRFVVKM